MHEDYEDDSEIVRINGQKALTIAITKESGGNIIQIARDVEKRLETINLPSGIYYQILFNSSDTIKNSIHNVLNTVWQGALFAVIVLMIYLWDVKSVFIISVSIPISVISTFILMYFFDITINVVSLSGLVLGIGMMVDNSIVVLENIFYYNNYYNKNNFSNDKRIIRINNFKSSILGASEVSIAITASTLTSVCVFLPFLFVQGQMGQMFSDLCITVSISLMTSLFVALTIVPLLASRLNSTASKNGKKQIFINRLENFFNDKVHDNVEKFYLSMLTIVMRNKKKAVKKACEMAVLAVFDDDFPACVYAANLYQRHPGKQRHAVYGLRRLHCGGMDLFYCVRSVFAPQEL